MMIPIISPRTVSSLCRFAVIFADRRERRIVWNRRKGQDDIALAELEYFNAFEPFKCARSSNRKLMSLLTVFYAARKSDSRRKDVSGCRRLSQLTTAAVLVSPWQCAGARAFETRSWEVRFH